MKHKNNVLAVNLRIEELELGVFSPRLQFDPKYIEELAEDIKNNDQQKPIICRPHPEKPNVYQVIDGETRIRALKQNASSLVRAEVRKLSDEEAIFLAMKINEMHGKRLNPIEEGLHIKRMIETQNLSEQQVAGGLKKSQHWVSDRLSLVYSLSSKVQGDVSNRLLTSTHAMQISKLPEEEQQEKVATYVKREKPSVKETKFLVNLVKESPSEAEEILSKKKTHLEAKMKHEEVIETSKRLEEVMIGKDRKQWIKDHTCVDCGRKFKILWKDGLIEWT